MSVYRQSHIKKDTSILISKLKRKTEITYLSEEKTINFAKGPLIFNLKLTSVK